jgi:hypothetical protein
MHNNSRSNLQGAESGPERVGEKVAAGPFGVTRGFVSVTHIFSMSVLARTDDVTSFYDLSRREKIFPLGAFVASTFISASRQTGLRAG